MNRGYTCPFRAKENKYLVGSSPPMVTQGADGEDNGIMRRRVNPRVATWGREGWAGTPRGWRAGQGQALQCVPAALWGHLFQPFTFLCCTHLAKPHLREPSRFLPVLLNCH